MEYYEEDDDHEHEDVHPALTKHDVLEKVFSFLSSSADLKACRLVSRIWEEGATPVLGKRCIFPIQNLLRPEITTLTLHHHPHPHPHLLRNVLILDQYPPLPLFLNVLNPALLTEFVFRGATFLGGLSTFLENVRYPHLKKLSLLEPQNVEPGSKELPRHHADQVVDTTTVAGMDHGLKALQKDADPASVFNLNLSMVSRLHFSVALHGRGFANSANFAIFQLLIQKCANLQELKISGNYYPDLGSCGRLKSLVWEGPWTKFSSESDIVFETTDFSLTKLIKMLEGVADRLEKLVLGCSSTEQEARARYVRGIIDMEEQIQTLENGSYELYPKMPKLAHFFVSDVAIFATSPESFTLERLPALKSLTLRSTRQYEFAILGVGGIVDSCLKKWQNMILAPESLSVNQCPVGVSDIWSGISNNFPNLKKLSLGMTPRDDPFRPVRVHETEHERDVSFMKCTLNIMAYLLPRLEDLRIHLKFGCTLEELMAFIWAKGFQGKRLKSLTIKAFPSTDNYKFCGNSCDNFREPFMLYKSLTLEEFEIEPATRQRMVNFIKKRKLNVNLFT